MPRKKIATPKPEATDKKYHLTLSFNGQTFEFDTDNLAESFKSVAPILLQTHLKVRVQYGDLYADRFVLIFLARKLFKSPIALDVFINKLIFSKNG